MHKPTEMHFTIDCPQRLCMRSYGISIVEQFMCFHWIYFYSIFDPFFLYKILDRNPQIQTHYIIRLFTKHSTTRDDRYAHYLKQGLRSEQLNRKLKSVLSLKMRLTEIMNRSITWTSSVTVFKFIEIANASSSSSLLMHYELRLNIYSFSLNLTPWVPIISACF